ncbi:MAG: hypothetical protein V4729_11940 [Pseudomonadota bacterium]
MATVAPGVPEHLALVAQKAIISNVDKGMAALPIKTLMTRIGAEFDRFVVARCEVAGAWARDTALPVAMDPAQDIDVLVVFRERGHLPAHYLALLHGFVQLHYPPSAIEYQDGCLRLKLLQVRLRLVPAHESLTGMQIPGGGRSWVRIDPAAALQQLTSRDAQHGGLILPVVRLARYWNVRNGRVFAGWALEQKVLGHRFGYVGKNLKAYWFDFMRALIVEPAASPARAEAVRKMRRDLDEIDQLSLAGKAADATARIEQMLPIPARLLLSSPFGGAGGYKPLKL